MLSLPMIFSDNIVEIDVTSLSKGFYTLRIQFKNGDTIEKSVVKE